MKVNGNLKKSGKSKKQRLLAAERTKKKLTTKKHSKADFMVPSDDEKSGSRYSWATDRISSFYIF